MSFSRRATRSSNNSSYSIKELSSTALLVSSSKRLTNFIYPKRFVGGYDKYVYGVSTDGVSVTSGTAYESGAGWVGVTTYIDNAHQLRVKKEILVAMSGITTGNIPVYDSDPGPFKPPA